MKVQTVAVLSERLPTEQWLTVGVFATEALAGAHVAAHPSRLPNHETRIELFEVVTK